MPQTAEHTEPCRDALWYLSSWSDKCDVEVTNEQATDAARVCWTKGSFAFQMRHSWTG